MLNEILPQVLFGFGLVFTRIGMMVMVMPVLGENTIPIRIRFTIAFLVSLVVYPVVSGGLPPLPGEPLMLVVLLGAEVVIGIFIGGAARLIMSTLNFAGTVIAFQSSMSVAQGFDPTQNSQGAVLGLFLTILGVVLIFATNLHHLLLGAMVSSFDMFPAGQFPDTGDFAKLATDIIAEAFILGMQIAAPFVAYGLIFYLGVGLLSRLMPQLQVFFIAMPLNIILSFLILMLVIGAGMTWFLDHFEETMMLFAS